MKQQKLIFLPGITGDGYFWKNVGDLLPEKWEKVYIHYPNLGTQPFSKDIQNWNNLLDSIKPHITQPCVLVAQSMGGILAVQLARLYPDLITYLVLTATSGGMDVKKYGATDWRDGFLKTFPNTPRWAYLETPNVENDFPKINIPTLLLWGDADIVSPPAVGQYLEQKMPNANLIYIKEGIHSMAKDFPDIIAPLIYNHINEK